MGHPITFLLFEISFFSIRPYLDYDKNLEYKQTLFFKKKAWKILKNDIIWRFWFEDAGLNKHITGIEHI